MNREYQPYILHLFSSLNKSFTLAVWSFLSFLPMDFIGIKRFSDKGRFGAML